MEQSLEDLGTPRCLLLVVSVRLKSQLSLQSVGRGHFTTASCDSHGVLLFNALVILGDFQRNMMLDFSAEV